MSRGQAREPTPDHDHSSEFSGGRSTLDQVHFLLQLSMGARPKCMHAKTPPSPSDSSILSFRPRGARRIGYPGYRGLQTGRTREDGLVGGGPTLAPHELFAWVYAMKRNPPPDPRHRSWMPEE